MKKLSREEWEIHFCVAPNPMAPAPNVCAVAAIPPLSIFPEMMKSVGQNLALARTQADEFKKRIRNLYWE